MPNQFSIKMTGPSGMGLGPAGRGAPVRTATKINEGARRGVIGAMVVLRKRQRDDLAMFGKHNPLTTRSTAPVGGPPQMASGKLRNSVTNTAPIRHGAGVWSSWVGPNANGNYPDVDRYSATQELGMVIKAKTPKGMWFVYGGLEYKRIMQVYVPPRPFTKGVRGPVAAAQARDAFVAGMKSVIGNQWYGNW